MTNGLFNPSGRFVFRFLRREARSGELRLLVAALVLAVAALTAVGFFADRVRQALVREAHQLLAADLLLTADHPWSQARLEEAAEYGLSIAQTQVFPSMVRHDERAGMAEIKAVSPAYPLRGRLRIATAPQATDAPAAGIPSAGEVWIDERLSILLMAQVGDRIALGDRSFQVSAILTQEPDRGANFFSFAPRLLMSLDDLPSTGLIQPGSRVTYRLLLAGEGRDLMMFRKHLEGRLARGERIEDTESARPEIRAALSRAQRFLGVCALLTVVLSAVVLVLASRRYLERHLDACAVMRCLGATQTAVLRLYVFQFAILGGFSSLSGCLLGYLAQGVLHSWLSPWLSLALPPPGVEPALQGLFVGLLLLFGFSLPSLWQLRQVSTLRVLRREWSGPNSPPWRLVGGYLLGLGGMVGLMFWVAGSWRLGTVVVGGFVGALLLFSLLARGAVRLAAALRGVPEQAFRGVGWRTGLAGLERRSTASVVQIVALALGFMALLLLTVIRNDLLLAWRQAVPADAPNRFVVNIQPDQRESVLRSFARAGLTAEFSPMVRARLVRVNGKTVSSEDYADERARRLVEREFNLSYRADLPSGNRVSAGRWFLPADAGQGAASVEEGLAKTLGIKVGDTLEFSVAGESVRLPVVGLRKLNWDSMRVNFFVLAPPAVLNDFPTSWITSFYLAPEKNAFVSQLTGDFPNLTVVDVAAILRQLQDILEHVTQAVQFVFLFTLAAGLLVLYAALASAAGERRYELAVMRALGARRKQLRSALLAELAAVGALAGLIAGVGALLVGQALAKQVFEFEMAVDLSLPFFASLGGGVLVAAAGWLAVSPLLNDPPLAAFRSGQ